MDWLFGGFCRFVVVVGLWGVVGAFGYVGGVCGFWV